MKVIRAKYLYPIKQSSRKAYFDIIYDFLVMKKQKRVFRLYGMKRSGNHAIINWLFNSMEGMTLLCNDIRRGKHPKTAYFNKLKFSTRIGGIICSYENQISSNFDLNYSEDYFGTYYHYKNIFLLRDPYNLFASRFAWKEREGLRFKTDLDYRLKVIDHWKENARTFLNWQKDSSSKNIPINYNNWCTSQEYRNSLIPLLGMKALNANTDKVLAFGGGSSFEGINKSAVNKKRFLQRFVSLIENPDFKSIFIDAEISELSEMIFGKIEKSEMLFK